MPALPRRDVPTDDDELAQKLAQKPPVESLAMEALAREATESEAESEAESSFPPAALLAASALV